MADQQAQTQQTEHQDPPPEPETVSDDEREYAAVMREVEEVEEAESTATGGGDPAAGQEAETTGEEAGSDTTTSTDAAGEGKAETGEEPEPEEEPEAASEQGRRRNDFIPKKQYDRQLARRRELEAENARLKARQEVLDELIEKGVLRGDQAAEAGARPNGSGQQAQQDAENLPPDQRLERLEQQLDTLETQYEEGELDLSQADYRQQRTALRSEIRKTEREALRADLMQTTPLGESPSVREESDRLERENAGWARRLEEEYPEYVELAQTAARLEVRRQFPDASPEQRLVEARKLAYQFGREHAERLGIAQVGQQQSSPRGNGQASNQQVGPTPEQRAQKLATAQKHPPEMSQLGGRTDAGAGSMTPEEFERADPDDLAKMSLKDLEAWGTT